MSGGQIKIIHFPQYPDGLDITLKLDVLWPCHAFRVTVPEPPKHELNIFEETILRLTEVMTGNTKRLCEATCIEEEESLVLFIQTRLYHLGYLEGRYELSENGKNMLNELNKEKDVQNYTSVTVYVDLLYGSILPFFKLEESYMEVSEVRRNNVEFRIGSKGRGKPISALRIDTNSKSFWKKTPKNEEVIKTIRDYQKKQRRRSNLQGNYSVYFPEGVASAVKVMPEPALVYLHCLALRQEANHEWLVTDGSGDGFSVAFAEFLKLHYSGWLNKKLGELGGERGTGGNKPKKQVHKYESINTHLAEAENFFMRASSELGDRSASQERKIRFIGDSLKALFDALEWTFHLIVEKYPAEEWRKSLAKGTINGNFNVIRKCADKIGLRNTENDFLLRVKPGDFNPSASKMAVMRADLAFALAGAANNSSHPLARAAAKEPALLSFLSELGILRNTQSHGKIARLKISELEEYVSRAKKIIILMIPDYVFDSPGSDDDSTMSNDADSFYNDRIRAEVRLNENFGTPFMYAASALLREQLFKLAMYEDSHPNDDENTPKKINCISSALELTLVEVLTPKRRFGLEESNIKSEAFRRASAAGFDLDGGAIPREIETVNERNVVKACRGESSTLGGLVTAFFLLFDEDELKETAEKLPGFIKTAARIVKYRGHGNQANLHIEAGDYQSLVKQLIEILKYLKERS